LKKLAQQHYDGMRDDDLAAAVFTPDCVTIDPTGQMDMCDFRAYGEAFLKALPDCHTEVRRMRSRPAAAPSGSSSATCSRRRAT
jgi:hypothetical protein